ncbi:MAG: penicillin acylase family protein [Cyanobacteria bacterium SZAS LIN-3]|nr:penicillin acylase family protein [Cyanobacteria bacterium SZAS LIN-3]
MTVASVEKNLLRVLLVIVVVIVLSATGFYFVAQRSLPTLDGIVSYPELSRGGVVKFDDRSVPYIEATTELDLYRIQGYVTAQDRLVQMDLLRRRALGELSEVFGSQSLSQDKLMRTIGIGRAVRDEVKALPREVRTALECYAQGVNTYIASNSDRLPLEFGFLGYRPKPWRVEDTLAILKYSQYELDESWRLDDLRQNVLDKVGDKIAGKLFERVFEAPPAVSLTSPARKDLRILPDQNISPVRGCNGWIVGNTLSDSKGALLSLDRHNAFSLPVDWYLVSMRSPDMHVAGATIPGVPGVVSGRNDKIGWGLLSLKVDVQDLYLEQFSPQMPGKYKIPTGWASATEIIEEIPVRFSGSLFSTSNLLHKVLITRHGPLLTKNQDSGVALSWIGTDALGHPEKSAGIMETLYRFNHAANWQQFQSSLQKYAGSPMTALYGDTTGNIGYQQAGTVPIRANGARFGKYESCLLTPGWTGFGDWVAAMPFADMDHAYNPPQGYFVANMAEIKNDLPVNVNYYRAQRIDAVLSTFKKSNQKLGLPDMALLQADQLAPLAPTVKAVISEAVTRSELIDVFQIKALDALNKWDGTLAADSAGAAIYESFLRTVARRVLEPMLDGEMTTEYLKRYPSWSLFVDRLLREKKTDFLPKEERTFKNFISTSFVQCLKDLRVSEKSEETSGFKWGDLHRIDFVNVIADAAPTLSSLAPVLNVSGTRVGGDQDTVATMESSLKRGKEQFACRQGSTMRLLIDMSDSEKFYQTLALGQSGNLFSGTKADQMRAFFSPNPVPLPMAFAPSSESKISQHRLLFSDK